METPNLNKTKTPVTLADIYIGDVIYLYDKPNAQAYSVINTGNPFIMIENLKTHFCNIYRPSIVYKEI